MKTLRLLPLKVLAFMALGLVSCKKDPCKKVSCQNGGTCVDGKCNCSLPWEGAKCEVDARDKFVGAWRGKLSCDGRPEDIFTAIVKSSSDNRAIVTADSIRAILTSSTTLEIPSQQSTSDSTAVIVGGNGRLNGDTLVLNITYSFEGQAVVCVYNLTRQ